MSDNTTEHHDDHIRHDATLTYAGGDPRAAINTLIQRINSTNGHCSPRIWLTLLDIYRIHGQQAAYEKLAVYFSNRFQYSPPAWEQYDNPNKPKETVNNWRNALVIDGSPSSILEEKSRDFIRASREEGNSRIDFSRMKLDTNEDKRKSEIQRLLDIMQRLRKIKCPTMLMGDSEVLSILEQRISQEQGTFDSEYVYWMLLFEILQWRGQEEKFERMVDLFAQRYEYCPVGFDTQGAIAVKPSVQNHFGETDDYDPEEVILEAAPLIDYINRQKDNDQNISINLKYVKRISSEVARDLAAHLQNKDGLNIEFTEIPEVIEGLFEATGVGAYATLLSQHAKLKELLAKKAS